jgi:cytochrome c oxidase cbb3-type subunit 3
MRDSQPPARSTRLREQSRGTQLRLILGTLGTALLTLSMLLSNPIQAQKKGSKQPPARPEQPAKRGHDLFVKNCSPCHGANAQGGEGPNLHGLKLNDQRISTTIQHGIQGEMPAFGDKFKGADIKTIIAYLRSLKK